MIKYTLIIISIILIALLSYLQISSNTQSSKKIHITQTNNHQNKVVLEKEVNSEPKQNNIKKSIKLQNIQSYNKESVETNENLSDFDKEMAENEKEIIEKFLNQKETLSRTYNLEEEDNIPTELESLQDEEEYDDISMEELERIEKENNLQPKVLDMPYIQEDTQKNIPMTKEELDTAEINAGMQETPEDNSEPLDEKDIPF